MVGEGSVRGLPEPLLHRHRGGDEGDLLEQLHVGSVREVLPAGHARDTAAGATDVRTW